MRSWLQTWFGFGGAAMAGIVVCAVAAMADPSAPQSQPAKPQRLSLEQAHDFWSFKPVADPAAPAVKNRAWALNPIDQFVLAELESRGLAPAPPADRRVLIRRATYDLTGLPPTPAEVADFLADSQPNAFARVVDRLLASPAYGERWGRHWLDVVRYADTAGETADYPVREAWKYRNWVIDAFNADQPYDQFIREQIAGDLLGANGSADQYAKQVTATGYIAISRRFGFDPENYMHLTLQDTLDNLGQTVLGLSIGCARCHDHKFDPISQEDYYGLYGIFASTIYAVPGSEEHMRPSDFPPAVPPAEAASMRNARTGELARFDAQMADASAGRAARVNSALTRFSIKFELRAESAEAEPAAGLLRPWNVPAVNRAAVLLHDLGSFDRAIAQFKQSKDELAGREIYPPIYGVADGKPQNAKIQKRGDPLKLGDEVPRHFLAVLGGDALPPGSKGSGRLELAGWLTRPQNPLTARVMANRIWEYHFGRGIVQTENNFGSRGKPPTHPLLLDWLASRFVEHGWSIKSMHRLMMLSQTYAMSSDFNAQAFAVDPEDDALWRFRRRRLDAEEIRDAMLAVGGNLDRTPAAGHPFPPVNTWGFTQHNPFNTLYDSTHRSVYLMIPRTQRLPFMELFDAPDGNVGLAHRDMTTVPTQALYMMNAPFVHEQSMLFARKLLAAEPDAHRRLVLAYQNALARAPSPDEIAMADDFQHGYLDDLGPAGGSESDRQAKALAAYLRTVMCNNEFLFVD